MNVLFINTKYVFIIALNMPEVKIYTGYNFNFLVCNLYYDQFDMFQIKNIFSYHFLPVKIILFRIFIYFIYFYYYFI